MFGIKMPWTKRKETREAEERLDRELLRLKHLSLVRRRPTPTTRAVNSTPIAGNDDSNAFQAIGLVDVFSARGSYIAPVSGQGGTFDGGGASGDWSCPSSFSDSSCSSSDSSSSSSDGPSCSSSD